MFSDTTVHLTLIYLEKQKTTAITKHGQILAAGGENWHHVCGCVYISQRHIYNLESQTGSPLPQ